jgi:bifunctional UDP-N-acetylglucosamine pyrophosphorylase/glucosamine-1-phosphate N-acetyltransferase
VNPIVKTATVILAAGYGTRMKSDRPKMMHPVMGHPMIDWAVRTAETVSQLRPVVVVGHRKELIQTLLGERATYAEQTEMLGTAHAVMQAAPLLQGQADIVLVTYGDMPLLRSVTVQQLIDEFARYWKDTKTEASIDMPRPAIVMLTINRPDAQGFGRVVRNEQGEIQAIIEEVDCTPAQKAITELNPGIYCFDAEWLWDNLSNITLSAKGEYYLTDMIAIAVAQGRRVETLSAPLEDVDGINTRVHLAHATAVMRHRILEKHMLNGVTIIDPPSTYIEDTVTIGQDSIIWPGSILRGQTVIGCHAVIGPNAQIEDSTIGDGCRVINSVVEQAQMDASSEIGPFGHLRKGAHLGEGVHMGNFGEVKNSYLAPGTKMGHFSYIGDATVDRNVNIGAGTVTCNFDGHTKNQTHIGEGAFIGSDTMLVAPVTIGAGARTGAGSVVTKDVPTDALVYGVPARQPASSDPVSGFDQE